MLRSRLFVTVLAFAALSSVASAASAPVIVTPETAQWQPAPGFKGFEMATIVGVPSEAGAYYAYYLKFPAGGQAPPHFHAMTENVVVISGTVMFGLGDTMDVTKMMTFGPGAVVSVPAGLHHYAMAKEPAVVEISGIGPDTTTLVHT